MDRITGPGFLQPFLPRKDDSSQKGKRTAESGKAGFLSFFTRAATENPESGPVLGTSEASKEPLETLLDGVYASGQELADNPSPENIVNYKKAVGRFIRQVIDGSVELTETEGRLRKDMRKPKYAVLHVIDERLEKLGAYVLQNQKDKLEILRKIDELHGLLVDLRH